METIGRSTGLRTPAEREFTLTGVIDAPREAVFNAVLDPSLIPQWWGPQSLTATVDFMDVRPGGEWRIVQSDAQGNQYASRGTYQEIDAPSRIEYTVGFEAMPDAAMVETVVFADQDGKTRVTFIDRFTDQEARDAALKSGMEEGVRESLERLSQLMAGKR
jgi:uncharacterized protein YndB with AHSA1/START domain